MSEYDWICQQCGKHFQHLTSHMERVNRAGKVRRTRVTTDTGLNHEFTNPGHQVRRKMAPGL